MSMTYIYHILKSVLCVIMVIESCLTHHNCNCYNRLSPTNVRLIVKQEKLKDAAHLLHPFLN